MIYMWVICMILHSPATEMWHFVVNFPARREGHISHLDWVFCNFGMVFPLKYDVAGLDMTIDKGQWHRGHGTWTAKDLISFEEECTYIECIQVWYKSEYRISAMPVMFIHVIHQSQCIRNLFNVQYDLVLIVLEISVFSGGHLTV